MAFWDRISSRGQVEDRRGTPVGAIGLGGGGLAIAAIFIIISLLGGGTTDPSAIDEILKQVQGNVSKQQLDTSEFAGQDDYEVFASTVLGSANDVWTSIFEQSGRTFREPKLVLFRGVTQSGCGFASSQTGPHYCPSDETIYLDETFFDELRDRLSGNSGDVAQAYVLAHEAGHHAQKLLGIMDEINQNDSQDSIRLELQADCFAGLWANSIKDAGVFENGEINEAIEAAEAVGDDNIQSTTTGRVNPETWTHGSSQQRIDWFNRGYTSGQFSACNTF